ncbi:DNA polymerase [Acidithiobacillus thiooxidans]|uniref:DNA polymerase I n=1 Tax=Acidithiobacillus thiooxidans ATCC 19377 TaxID=637390 RepID=A0A543Q4A1_ACITH|nr:DNA polymerase [Acidithiobacillus thiooxidans]MDX5934718.1 DNA polymerase [Acidithiobacillus thiooxidans]TQN51159.1 DNA polymerase I [Acidithiobacillus thiooxidans ATCC 19377]
MTFLSVDEAGYETVCRPQLFATAQALPELESALQNGPCEVILDFETTGATPWLQGTLTGKIGDEWTITQYRKKYGCTADSKLRARVLSIGVPDNHFRAAFDLDRMDEAEQRRLIQLLSGHYWVGHNLQFDYAWALSICPDVRPTKLIDTMLMVTCFRSELPYEMQAATEPNRTCLAPLRTYARAKALSKAQDGGGGVVSLRALSLLFFDVDMDKRYQKPINWTPAYLTAAHHDYCLGDIDVPGHLARLLMGLPCNTPMQGLLAGMQQAAGYAAYNTMTEALHTLVRMQRKGFYWDTAKAAVLGVELQQEAENALPTLLSVAPSLEPFTETLMDPAKGMTDVLKTAIGEALYQETGQQMPKTNKGEDSTSADALKQAFPNSRIVAPYLKVVDAISEIKKLREYGAVAAMASDGRIHAATSILTTTGRTSSRNPNLQNIPRDPRFRSIFAAPVGYKLIATDFSSVELRIAAALGVRALKLLHQILAAQRGHAALQTVLQTPLANLRWIFREVPELQMWLANPLQSIPASIRTAKAEPGRDVIFRVRALAVAKQFCMPVQTIWRASGGDPTMLAMRRAFADGLDPHIMTALAMEAAAGRFDLQGKLPVDYLQSLSPEERKTLKTALKGPRQAAKGVNFGLLYGMSAEGLHEYGKTGYGLDWTLDEAVSARQVFFNLYPELALWHWLLKYAMKQKRPVLNPYNPSEMQTAEAGGKVYWGSTLSGRPTVAAKTTAASNYMDQGSGAEIALTAINRLPDDVKAMLVNFVHDEIILEVPEERVAEVQAALEQTMIAAADSFLMPFRVPTEVESAVGDCWIH